MWFSLHEMNRKLKCVQLKLTPVIANHRDDDDNDNDNSIDDDEIFTMMKMLMMTIQAILRNQRLACVLPHLTDVIGPSDLVPTLSSSANMVLRIMEIHFTISEKYILQDKWHIYVH